MIEHTDVLKRSMSSLSISYVFDDKRVWTQLMDDASGSGAYVYSAKQWGGHGDTPSDAEIRRCLTYTVIVYKLFIGEDVYNPSEVPKTGW